MRIKFVFIVSVLLAAILLVGVSASAIITNAYVERASRQSKLAHAIAQTANELSYLSNDFLVYRENQQFTRWQFRYGEFATMVAGLQAYKADQQTPIRNIQASSQRIKEVFDSIVSAVANLPQNQGGAIDPAFLQVSWSRMAVQSQSLVSEATHLSELYDNQVDQLRRANLLAVYGMMGFFVIYLLVNYIILQRRILNSLGKLQAGTATIGAGNLDYKIEVKENDEIGDLSRAFNLMTSNLKEVTASKTDLEMEIARRVEAEEELKISNEHLQENTQQLEEEINRRAEVEEELENTAAQREMALDAAKMGWWRYDPVTQISYWDERYKEIFEVTESHQHIEEILKHLHPDDLPGVWAKVEAALDPVNPQPFSGVYRFCVPDGSIKWIEAHGTATFEGVGRDRHATSFVGTVVDITERKQAEAEITHLASFPELNPNPVVELGAEGKINYINPAAKTSFPELMEKGLEHPFLAGLGDIIQKTNAQTFTRDINIGDSWYEQTISRVQSTQHYRIYARDITSRKEAEDELKQRTAELEISNKELESFSYTVSHDLRAPLRSMDGFSQALLEDYASKLDEQAKGWLQSIRNSSQRMAQLIDDILGLSRVVRTELRFEWVDLSTMANSIGERLKNTEPKRRVIFDIAPGLKVWGDTGLLDIALDNLLGNAFKFTARCESAHIELGTSQRNDKRLFYVRDNGVGFEMKYVDKLFKPFQRLHSDKDYPGTGIGLVTVERIIKRHGGEVWAESNEGKGATFYFTLG